jgi:uncharacterized protein
MAAWARVSIPLALLALALAHGCLSSRPTRLYLLTPVRQGARDCPPGPRVSIGVSPAELPKYLNRPQIVARAGPGELSLSELDQWAEPLGEGLSRVVARNLEGLVCAEVFPLSGAGTLETDYRVGLVVLSLDGSPDGEAVLDARWFVFGRGGTEPLFTREARFTREVPGPGRDDLVSAWSTLAACLSRDIAGFFLPAP